MAVKRMALSQALAKDYAKQYTTDLESSNNNYVRRNIGNINYTQDESQRDLLQGQQISQMALNSDNFGGGKAGWAGLAAQLGTAGIGAYTQYKAQKEINERELASQQQFASQFPHLADIASTLSPETRQAYTLEALKQDLKANDPSAQLDLQSKQLEVQGKQLGLQKTQAEIGKIRKETATAGMPDIEKTFKNATALRSDYITHPSTKTFQSAKEGYERVVASSQDPSAAGDLSLIFGYMKILDPNSTVRESEFNTVEGARGLPESLQAIHKKIISGERLTTNQRNDFIDRATKLYNQAEKSQNKIAAQYTAIAKRNQINPEDVVVDFSTTTNKPPVSNFTLDERIAEAKRRGLIK